VIVQILLVAEVFGNNAAAVAKDDFAFADFESVRDAPEDKGSAGLS
jgi:hypothetical protein